MTDRDPRCKMITLDPDTGPGQSGSHAPRGQSHGGTAGVYGAVVVEGVIRAGDEIAVVEEEVRQA